MIDIKVSIIVPVYNAEKYLKKCLNSLVKQTLDEIEIIIINDGSVDKSQEIINEFSNQYPDKIKSYIQSNSGQAVARNFGLKKAIGEYVLFIDSDDYIELNTCERGYEIAKQGDLDIVCFNMREEFETNLEKYCVSMELITVSEIFLMLSSLNLLFFFIGIYSFEASTNITLSVFLFFFNRIIQVEISTLKKSFIGS